MISKNNHLHRPHRGALPRISFQTSNRNATKFPKMNSNSVGGVKGAGEAALESGGCRLGGGGLSSYIYHHHAESQARRWRGRSR